MPGAKGWHARTDTYMDTYTHEDHTLGTVKGGQSMAWDESSWDESLAPGGEVGKRRREDDVAPSASERADKLPRGDGGCVGGGGGGGGDGTCGGYGGVTMRADAHTEVGAGDGGVVGIGDVGDGSVVGEARVLGRCTLAREHSLSAPNTLQIEDSFTRGLTRSPSLNTLAGASGLQAQDSFFLLRSESSFRSECSVEEFLTAASAAE